MNSTPIFPRVSRFPIDPLQPFNHSRNPYHRLHENLPPLPSSPQRHGRRQNENKSVELDKQIDASFENAKSRSDEQGAYDQGRILWEKEMNRVYAELTQGLSKEAAALLKKSQRNWLTFRTQQIAYLDEFYKALSGTMYLTAHSYAVMDVTRLRTLSLARQLQYIDEGEYVND